MCTFLVGCAARPTCAGTELPFGAALVSFPGTESPLGVAPVGSCALCVALARVCRCGGISTIHERCGTQVCSIIDDELVVDGIIAVAGEEAAGNCTDPHSILASFSPLS